ncbi:hypothetical protein [Chloroflexus sp.]|uniref:hypothetical protein n=1 Tax=Chloroflexus sp. TaxID=1904827 RepID=UPI002ACD7858|nr:hypothetical protein [Chloroflexus sp.]
MAYLLCHRRVTPAGAVLYLEGDDGKVAPVTTARLVQSGTALTQLAGALAPSEHTQLNALLQQHIATRAGLIDTLRIVFDQLNDAFDAINGLVAAGDVAGAIRRKHEVTAQFSDGLAEIRRRLRSLSRDVTTVSAA